MDPRRRCPAPSRRSSSRCPGRWSPWPVPGNRGCLTPPAPPPPGAGPPGPPPGPWPLRGWRRGDTARPCPPPGLPSPGAGRERSLSLSPKRGWDGWHSRWPAGPEPAPGAERDVFAWGTTLRNHGLTPGNSIMHTETWPPRRGLSGSRRIPPGTGGRRPDCPAASIPPRGSGHTG